MTDRWIDDVFYEGTEQLVLVLTLAGSGSLPPSCRRPTASARPARSPTTTRGRTCLAAVNPLPPHVVEGGDLKFEVRLRDQGGTVLAPSATEVTGRRRDPGGLDHAGDYGAGLHGGLTDVDVPPRRPLHCRSRCRPRTTASPRRGDRVRGWCCRTRGRHRHRDRWSATARSSTTRRRCPSPLRRPTRATLEFELRVVWPRTPPWTSTPLTVGVTYQLVATELAAMATQEPAAVTTTSAAIACHGHDRPSPTTGDDSRCRPATTLLVEPDETFWLELSTVTNAVEVPADPGTARSARSATTTSRWSRCLRRPAEGTEGQPARWPSR